MLLVKIIENEKIDSYFRSGYAIYGLLKGLELYLQWLEIGKIPAKLILSNPRSIILTDAIFFNI